MKKILITLLILTLSIGLVACGGDKNAVTTDDAVSTTEPASNSGDITPDVGEDTVGGQHWAAFVAEKTANPDITAEELASKLASLEINQFMPAVAPVEEGFLSGFENYEVKGFESGAMFAPMIGSIAYVGYVFDLADGTDVNAFAEGLTANANPRWNICVAADQTVCGSVGNTVFFLMCPETYEMPEMGEGDEELGGDIEIPAFDETAPAAFPGEETPATDAVAEVTEAVVVETTKPAVTEAVVVETTKPAAPEAPKTEAVVNTTATPETTTAVPETEAEVVTTVPASTEAPAEETTPAMNITAPKVDAASVGGRHWNAFVAEKTANSDITAEELAYKLVSLEINQFMGGTVPVEEGFLSGFENYEVKGFESGAMFAPMIGSIAYVGYVFDLADGADVNAFMKGLTDNANPRWNICVMADQTVCGSVGNTVFFLMCPETYEIPTEGGDMGGMALD